MLLQLHIENVAVIERADIDFEQGFSALTGETGAGKSILIDSINALLGERVSKDMIRSGCDKAFVRAMFCVSDNNRALAELLNDFGIEAEDGMLLLQREIHADGRSVCRVNSRICNVSSLREIGHCLVNVHGQQDSTFLLNPLKHLSYLDMYADNQTVFSSYSVDYDKVCGLRKELQSINTDEQEKERRLDLLSYQIKEIEDASLTVGEEEDLLARRKVLMNAEKIMDVLYKAHELLKEKQDSVCDMMSSLRRSVGSVSNVSDDFSALFDKVQNVSEETEDLAETISDLQRESEFSPRELDDVENRLDLINRLERKYGKTLEEVLAFHDKSKQEWDEITFSDERKRQLEMQLKDAEAKLSASAAELTLSRQKAAQKLDKAIINELAFLDMPSAKFITSIAEKDFSSTGKDDVQFLLSVNVGEEPKPLSKIASGGELSRIMLGIRSVLSSTDGIETLIFDEIDTGVSGRAAQKIAVKMRSMSSSGQVIAVTHLAPIAAYAMHHFLIEKTNDGQRTFTKIIPLDKERRVKEVGRLLGGADLTPAVLQAAKEMICKAE